MKKYLCLFYDFFKIGLFTFGGGYAMISLISAYAVEKRKYIDEKEFSDLVVIAESTPGPIAINSATYIGYRVGGVLGSIIASIAVSLPSFLIITIISIFFDRFLQYEIVKKAFKGISCAIAVLIMSAAIKLFKNVKKNWLSYLLIILSAIFLILFDIISVDISTIFFILLGGFIGFLFYYPNFKKQEKLKNEANNNEFISVTNEENKLNEKDNLIIKNDKNETGDKN